jgi:hypothetical protein
VTKNPEKALRE